jgi:hypothetical protein
MTLKEKIAGLIYTASRETDMPLDFGEAMKEGYGGAEYAADVAARILEIPELKEALGKCCDGGPQWGHAWNCPTTPD